MPAESANSDVAAFKEHFKDKGPNNIKAAYNAARSAWDAVVAASFYVCLFGPLAFLVADISWHAVPNR